jgi:hypothetical protein
VESPYSVNNHLISSFVQWSAWQKIKGLLLNVAAGHDGTAQNGWAGMELNKLEIVDKLEMNAA